MSNYDYRMEVLSHYSIEKKAGGSLQDIWSNHQKPAEAAYTKEVASEIKKHVMAQAKSRFQKGFKWSEGRGIYRFQGISNGGQHVVIGLQVNPRLGVILTIKIDGRDAPGFSGHIPAEQANRKTPYDIAGLYFMDVE